MNDGRDRNPIELAAFLSTGEIERFYAGLSLLVSAAADGRSCAALVSFRALELLIAGDLEERALDPAGTPSLVPDARADFARSLVELVKTARELESLKLYACSASRDGLALTEEQIGARLDGVMSTPRFLRHAAGAQLIFI